MFGITEIARRVRNIDRSVAGLVRRGRTIEDLVRSTNRIARQLMSKVDEALEAQTVIIGEVVTELVESQAAAAAAEERAARAEAERDAVIAGDSAEDAAQVAAALEEWDTAASDKIKAVTQKLAEAITGPGEPDPGTDPEPDPVPDPDPVPETPVDPAPVDPEVPADPETPPQS